MRARVHAFEIRSSNLLFESSSLPIHMYRHKVSACRRFPHIRTVLTIGSLHSVIMVDSYSQFLHWALTVDPYSRFLQSTLTVSKRAS